MFKYQEQEYVDKAEKHINNIKALKAVKEIN